MATTTAARSNGGIGGGDALKAAATILTIAAMLIGIAAGYGQLQQRLDDACARIEKLEDRVELIQVSNTQTQVDLATIRTDLATVKTDLTYIRDLLERRQAAP